jgi:hypothetical protein
VCDDAGRVSPAASGLTAPDRILAFLVGSQVSARSDQLFVEDADNVPNFSGGPALRTAQHQDYETLSSDLLTLFGDLGMTTGTPIAA